MTLDTRWYKSPHDDAMNVVRPFRLIGHFPDYDREQYYYNEEACRKGSPRRNTWIGPFMPRTLTRERYKDGQWIPL